YSSDYIELFNDRGSLAKDHISIYRVSLPGNYIRFGDAIVNSHHSPSFPLLIAIDHPGFIEPIGYELEYKINRETKKCCIWKPIPPNDQYTILGFVCSINTETKPTQNTIRCVHKSLLIEYGEFKQQWIEHSNSV